MLIMNYKNIVLTMMIKLSVKFCRFDYQHQ